MERESEREGERERERETERGREGEGEGVQPGSSPGSAGCRFMVCNISSLVTEEHTVRDIVGCACYTSNLEVSPTSVTASGSSGARARHHKPYMINYTQ